MTAWLSQEGAVRQAAGGGSVVPIRRPRREEST